MAIFVAAFVGGGAAWFNTGTSNASTDAQANTVRSIAGAPAYGPSPGLALNDNFVGLASTRTGHGYWIAAADGGVFSRGDARFHGSAASLPLLGPVVGITRTPTGNGYWLAAADGGVFAYGDADFAGSLGGYRIGNAPLNAPITAIAHTPSGHGYWLLGGDGGVFSFGDADFLGSATALPHSSSFVGVAPTKSGHGYYLLEDDGGVFTFGDARFYGSSVDESKNAVGIAVIPGGHGYQVARSDGSVLGFGGAPSVAAPADGSYPQHPVVAIAARPGGGSWLARGYVPPPPPAPVVDLSQDPFLRCTRAHESDTAGGYQAVSPGGVYHGAYQFLQSTWNNIARAMGRFDLVGVDPAAAAPNDQDQVALFLYHHSGAAPWGGRCSGMP